MAYGGRRACFTAEVTRHCRRDVPLEALRDRFVVVDGVPIIAVLTRDRAVEQIVQDEGPIAVRGDGERLPPAVAIRSGIAICMPHVHRRHQRDDAGGRRRGLKQRRQQFEVRHASDVFCCRFETDGGRCRRQRRAAVDTLSRACEIVGTEVAREVEVVVGPVLRPALAGHELQHAYGVLERLVVEEVRQIVPRVLVEHELGEVAEGTAFGHGGRAVPAVVERVEHHLRRRMRTQEQCVHLHLLIGRRRVHREIDEARIEWRVQARGLEKPDTLMV